MMKYLNYLPIQESRYKMRQSCYVLRAIQLCKFIPAVTNVNKIFYIISHVALFLLNYPPNKNSFLEGYKNCQRKEIAFYTINYTINYSNFTYIMNYMTCRLIVDQSDQRCCWNFGEPAKKTDHK